MASLERRRWNSEASLELSLPRLVRRSCNYDAHIPDKLGHRRFTFDGAVTADLTDAEHSIVRLDNHAVALVDTEALARLLLRAEAVASSKIEGLEVGARPFSEPRPVDSKANKSMTSRRLMSSRTSTHCHLRRALSAKIAQLRLLFSSRLTTVSWQPAATKSTPARLEQDRTG